MKKNIIQKLTSRKFIMSVITAIAGIITLFVGKNEIVQIIAGASMTIVPTVIYCLMEGLIDSKNIKTIANASAEVAEKLGANKQTVQTIEQVGELAEQLTEQD